MAPATYKIFVGNLDAKVNSDELIALFEKYGDVLECVIIKNFAFVHMLSSQARAEAIKQLNGTALKGKNLIVVEGKAAVADTKKFFIGNLSDGVAPAVVRALFEKYGKVVECDVVRNYGFVHLECSVENMRQVLRDLNGTIVEGKPIKVQMSVSRVRSKPGMGDPERCFRCGRTGHWSKQCQYAFATTHTPRQAATTAHQRSKPEVKASKQPQVLPYSYNGMVYFDRLMPQSNSESQRVSLDSCLTRAGLYGSQRAYYRRAFMESNTCWAPLNGRRWRNEFEDERLWEMLHSSAIRQALLDRRFMGL